MQVIVALDVDKEATALNFADACDPSWCALKVGLEAFTRFGPSFVASLVQRGFRVFLDLKFHDIPNTVAKACKSAADLGVWMMNVHISGGLSMMQAAREALDEYKADKPLLIGVTVLTSQNASEAEVMDLAISAKRASLDGVVCSALEVPALKAAFGPDFLTVTPGIRQKDDSADDQKRIVTPEDAKQLGSDYAVIGRSIMRAKDPIQVLQKINRV